MDDFALADELEKISGVKIPRAIDEIRTAPVRTIIQWRKQENAGSGKEDIEDPVTEMFGKRDRILPFSF